MQPDVRFLNGIWEGASVPFRGEKEPTKWVDCDLNFESSTVTGTGISQWRGLNISFRISGKYDASTGVFEITKKHEGKFMNALLFRGRIDFERRELRGQYRSGNFYLMQTTRPSKPSDSKRVMHPRPISQTGHTLSHLSGSWAGEHIHHKTREITIWHNSSLEFTLQSGQGQFGKVEGQGESLWRDQVIPFKLNGTFDLKQLWVDLLKTYMGKYPNRQYRMLLDLKHVQMTGDDGHGVLTLRKASGHSIITSTTTSYPTSLSSSPSTPTRPISPSSQNSHGAISPTMPALESYRRVAPNSSQSGGGGNGGSSGQSFFRSQSIPSSTSISRSSSIASTNGDFFEKENNKNQPKTLDYDDFDSSSLESTRLKLGKLSTDDVSTPKSTTTIIENTPVQEKFICYLDGMMSHTPSSTIPPSLIHDKRVTKDMYILSAKQSQVINDFRFKHKISDEDNKLVMSQLKIVDLYSNMYESTPTISYEKRRSFTRGDELSPTSYTPQPRSTYPSTRNSRLLTGPSRGGGGSETGGDSSSGDSVETEQSSSSGGSSGVSIDDPYVSVTGEPDVGRDAYAFYEPEPQTKEDLSPVSPNVEEESSDLCKVCFDSKMNCVIVPCGHYSICMKCALLLTNCPVCRGKIEQRQLVFRA